MLQLLPSESPRLVCYCIWHRWRRFGHRGRRFEGEVRMDLCPVPWLSYLYGIRRRKQLAVVQEHDTIHRERYWCKPYNCLFENEVCDTDRLQRLYCRQALHGL